MKKIAYTLCFFLALGSLTSCKSEAKKDTTSTTTETVTKSTAAFSLKNAENSINWVGYKTTEKTPVKGQFKKVEITKGGEGNTAKEAINGAEFKIPLSSIITGDKSRDFKIQKFFFGVMENTTLLSGKFTLENDTNKGFVELTMNGNTQKLPFDYSIENKTFSMNTVMDINKWNAQSAVASLNEACKDLHKGADGVSKTWSEVAINVVSTFN